MSGEWFTCDLGLNEYDFKVLAEETAKINPLMGMLLEDLLRPIHALNYWQSGDSSEETFKREWKAFMDKWFSNGVPIDEVKKAMLEEVERKIDLMCGTVNKEE